MEDNLELQKIKLEERRLTEEAKFTEMEIRLREQEIELQRKQYEDSRKEKGFAARMLSPVGVAVTVALLGLFGIRMSDLSK